ncbi:MULTISPECIES: anaerobic ribonucleoside-triphosphate reductase activating protein [Clostridia]|jgi:anaerobic ribonucleoside-triphosphate reductase activating protein|uniref:Anaerobic ribonucleoside-triphosphate reductase-activating protein n=1 Tax=Clostridium saudiense TaxID=1414720 RepID=A0ABS2FDS6_9CLOT|nr:MULTISPECIES: anaerobic ribonucleoside-triphosphate reductase activating protein [Clostridiaceae]MBM6818504.1 anaerobic ribonucleoside-triphosphate reductase activating protein [Clostridium saudiense]
MSKTVRLAGIAYESLVNGPGMRRVFFAQGCKHKCKGCFNPETHSFEDGEIMDMDKLIKDVLDNPILKGVTFSGGDPIEQAHSFAYMAKAFKNSNLNIWCYTGYTFEKLLEVMKVDTAISELLNNIDVLVDGRFEINNKEEGLRFRGSTNQRIINVKESLNQNKVVIMNL